MRNCTQCGAPLATSICSYCGTKTADNDFDRLVKVTSTTALWPLEQKALQLASDLDAIELQKIAANKAIRRAKIKATLQALLVVVLLFPMVFNLGLVATVISCTIAFWLIRRTVLIRSLPKMSVLTDEFDRLFRELELVNRQISKVSTI